jgi:hypothetical protein
MVDHLHGDAAGGRLREGARGVGIEACLGLLVDLGLQRRLQRLEVALAAILNPSRSLRCASLRSSYRQPSAKPRLRETWAAIRLAQHAKVRAFMPTHVAKGAVFQPAVSPACLRAEARDRPPAQDPTTFVPDPETNEGAPGQGGDPGSCPRTIAHGCRPSKARMGVAMRSRNERSWEMITAHPAKSWSALSSAQGCRRRLFPFRHCSSSSPSFLCRRPYKRATQ